MIKAQHRETFTVRAYTVDTQKAMQVPDLVRLMHECAMQHVMELNLSVWDLEPQHLAWVLTRISVRVHQLPQLGDEITIVTNPSGFERVRTHRDYWVYNAEGALLVSAVSLWFLMDTHTRRLARVPENIKSIIDNILGQVSEFLPRVQRSKPAPFGKISSERSYKVGYHDLDFNGHLNNIHYAKWLLDAIPGDFQQRHCLESMDIFYKAECVLDEELSAQANPLDECTWQLRLVKGEQEVALAESTWRPLS